MNGGVAVRGIGLSLVALLGLAPPAMAEVVLTPVQVVQLAQSALIVLGQDPGHVDGRLGPRTRAAIDAYVAASGLEMGWNGRTLDQGQAMSLNVAAGPALEQAFGFALDGRFGFIGSFGMDHTDALMSGDLDGVDGGVDCATAPDQVAEIDGLIVFEPDRPPAIVTVASPEMEPLPPSGAWHPEAEPWRLVAVWNDVISFVQEGDHYVYGRCQ
jgi:peptidoglycan hydrolase-like protein with peptidoglycan-binding domain